MVALPVCTGAVNHALPHSVSMKVRQPFRLYSPSSKHRQLSASSCKHCCFKAKRHSFKTRCQASQHDNADSSSDRMSSVQSLTTEALTLGWAAPLFAVALPFSIDLGGGNGSGGGGSGGDGSGGDGGSGDPGQGSNSGSNVIADVAADDDDDEDDDEESSDDDVDEREEEEEKEPTQEAEDGSSRKELKQGDPLPKDTYLVEAVYAAGLPRGSGIPKRRDLFGSLHCQPGFPVTEEELQRDVESLMQSQMFKNVRLGKHKGKEKGKTRVSFVCEPKDWPPVIAFCCKPPDIFYRDDKQPPPVNLAIPWHVVKDAMRAAVLIKDGYASISKAKEMVEGWYHDRGYVFAYISNFRGLQNGKIKATLIEGRVKRVSVMTQNEMLQTQPATPDQYAIVKRELPFKQGEIYSSEDGRKALQKIFALNQFENVQIMPKVSEDDRQGIDVEVIVKERPAKIAEAELLWGLAPNERGIPTLADKAPGGTLTYENRRLGKHKDQFSASITAENFWEPNDDIGFKVDWKRPYPKGIDDVFRTSWEGTAFNNRKTSGVFNSSSQEVPAIWVDRAGAKVGIHEVRNATTKANYNVVLEEITTRDEQGQIVTSGSKTLPSGNQAPDGPPTTHSSKGKDRVAFLQANITRDATHLISGTPAVGTRTQINVEQSLGLGIMPFFNKHSFSWTNFIWLFRADNWWELANMKRPPPVAVLHARYAGCMGDLASYDLNNLGGPYSVRGYHIGELASSRRVLETAAEVRLPVPKLNTHAYAFIEHGTDLGSSKDVVGNPTAYFRKAGSGSSIGIGLKLAALRTECIWDQNSQRRGLWAHFGERF